MVTFKIYVEGGGDGAELDSDFRRAWRSFFRKAGLEGQMPKVLRGKGRGDAYEKFRLAVKERPAGEVPLLLVDSETVPETDSVWKHLEWECPNGASSQDAFLMICTMETWIVADRAALARVFGKGFRGAAIPQWRDLEAIPKKKVLESLKSATQKCGKKYAKGSISFEALEEADPGEVAKACPAAKRFLDRLRKGR